MFQFSQLALPNTSASVEQTCDPLSITPGLLGCPCGVHVTTCGRELIDSAAA